jgi:hypothetical protein
MDTKQSLAALIAETIENCYMGIDGLPTAEEIGGFLEIPPQKEMGDYAFPCFKLSRALRMGPPQIASTLASAIDAGDLCTAKQQGGYLNFSGCGNTMNCNNAVVRNSIIDALRYWASSFHIDGFRFDLASILSRDEEGRPMPSPPIRPMMTLSFFVKSTAPASCSILSARAICSLSIVSYFSRQALISAS